MKTLTIFIILLTWSLSSISQDTIYVKYDAPGKNNGTSWEDAYQDLQTALGIVKERDQIWIARGIYKPTNGLDRNKSFSLKSNVAIYGGFVDTTDLWLPSTVFQHISAQKDMVDTFLKISEDESLAAGSLIEKLDEQLNMLGMESLQINMTILSGNIGNQDSTFDNSFHVVSATEVNNVHLHGLVITAGNANANSSIARGGGIYNYKSNIRATNCLFLRNNGIRGGGYYLNEGKVVFEDCTFLGNLARQGGGIYMDESKLGQVEEVPKFKNCHFIGNSTWKSNASAGGGIFMDDSSPEFISSSFVGNWSDSKGGGIYYLGNNTTTLFVDQCRLIGNIAEGEVHGGGAYTIGGNKIIISNTNFERNLAGYGGGLYCNGNSPEISSCIFSKNSASKQGGGLMTSRSEFSLIDCIIRYNHAGNQGGGLYISQGAPTLLNCQLIENTASAGGGIAMANVASSELLSSEFIGNYARVPIHSVPDGGGIFSNGSNILIDKCVFTRNWATNTGNSPNQNGNGNGGAIHAINSSKLTISHTFYHQNLAYWGGGINSINSSVFIQNSTFAQDTAFFRGGGIHHTEDDLMLQNCTFSANVASAGGGISNENEGELHIASSTFTTNRAVNNFGGGLHLVNAEASIKNSIIAANFARQRGSDIYNASSTLNSLGHNLIGDLDRSGLSTLATDIVGLAPRLEKLAANGGYTPTHALKPDSPALRKGETLKTTEIMTDQRGYSRFIASHDEAIDIGAFEQQYTIVSAPVVQTCTGSDGLFSLDDILISDSTGGAWLVDDTLNSIVLSVNEGITLNTDQLMVDCAEGLNCQTTVKENAIHISYERPYTTDPNTIRIEGLRVKISTTSDQDTLYIFRTAGDAIQHGNAVEDAIPHATIIVIPTIEVGQTDCKMVSNPLLWTPEKSRKRPLWEWDTIPRTLIPDYEENVQAWITDADSAYRENENTWIYSPCFDLKEMQRPLISLDKWADAEMGYDGTVIQYQTNTEEGWKTLGTDTTGINWYTSRNLGANPGNQPTREKYGWDGQDSSWVNAFHRLDGLGQEGFIRFRIAFASIEVVLPDANRKGFAFKDVSICERNRKVLLEYFGEQFTHHPKAAHYLETAPNDIITLNYGALLNQSNISTTSRAFYYGISKLEHLAFAGNQYIGTTDELPLAVVDTASLRGAKFSITFNQDLDEFIQIYTHVPIANSEQIVIYVAVKNEKDQFQGFLPSAAGITFWGKTWRASPSQTISANQLGKWKTDQQPENIEGYKLLVFVQNYYTKEIYQAEEIQLSQALINEIVDRDRRGNITPNRNIHIYPNPVDQRLFIDLPFDSEGSASLKLLDMQGRLVLTHQLSQAQAIHEIDLGHFANGVYYLELTTEDERYQKLLIIR